MLKQEFLDSYKYKTPPFGYNGLGYITYLRTYSRKVEGTNRIEDWHETVARCVNWLAATHIDMNIYYEPSYYEELYDAVFNLKANFSGRMLWQAGTKTVEKFGGASMCNCWAVVCDCKQSFLSTLDYLMLGGGVGYNIQERYVNKLPKIKKNVIVTRQDDASADFIVPDTRQGWVALLDKTLSAYFETGDSFTYSTHLIRGYGEPIKGFGGTASGPEPLAKGIGKICEIISAREGKQLRPIDCLDVMNCLGELVVAGNVRRSAQIALGDVHDMKFLEAKDWSSGTIPNHRAMSNNTVICNDFRALPEKFWDGYNGNGEPYGLFNLELARNKGRLVDNHRSDPDAVATNPCAEITLSPSEGDGGAESCNLCEIYLNNLKDVEEFTKVAKLMYPVVKTIALLPYHNKATQKIVKKNLRLGIGLTGIVMKPDLVTPEVLTKVYQTLESEDNAFAFINDTNRSIKLTTVKPSGTLSLLGGATPGVHPAYAPYYIRRVRMASHDSLIKMCRDAGYKTEYVKNFDCTEDYRTMIVEFPVKLDDGVVVAKDMTAIKQLELHAHMQRYWADNQVSVTVYYKKEELPAIRAWLAENYNENVKTVSFLLHNEHGFAQAPYEEITAEKYAELIADLKPLKFGAVEELDLVENAECISGHCPTK